MKAPERAILLERVRKRVEVEGSRNPSIMSYYETGEASYSDVARHFGTGAIVRNPPIRRRTARGSAGETSQGIGRGNLPPMNSQCRLKPLPILTHNAVTSVAVMPFYGFSDYAAGSITF